MEYMPAKKGTKSNFQKEKKKKKERKTICFIVILEKEGIISLLTPFLDGE